MAFTTFASGSFYVLWKSPQHGDSSGGQLKCRKQSKSYGWATELQQILALKTVMYNVFEENARRQTEPSKTYVQLTYFVLGLSLG
jgi:hypothetical protein